MAQWKKQTFAFRLARMIVKKQKWIVSLFVIGCLFSLIAMFSCKCKL